MNERKKTARKQRKIVLLWVRWRCKILFLKKIENSVLHFPLYHASYGMYKIIHNMYRNNDKHLCIIPIKLCTQTNSIAHPYQHYRIVSMSTHGLQTFPPTHIFDFTHIRQGCVKKPPITIYLCKNLTLHLDVYLC